jgi:hypothetical protein
MKLLAVAPEIQYLAGPYNDPDPDVRELRFRQLNHTAGWLLSQGMVVYSPISMTHPIAVQHELPKDWSFWEHQDLPFLRVARKVIVLMLPGWTESRGVKAETAFAVQRGLAVEYLRVQDVPGLEGVRLP